MFLVESDTQAKDLVQSVLDKFAVADAPSVVDYFAIYESLDGHSINGALSPEDVVVEHVKKWSATENGDGTEAGKLVFMIRLFMPCLWGLEFRDQTATRLDKPASTLSVDVYLGAALLRDEALVHLQYIQALFHVVTSQYPTSEEQALTLGALHFIYKFGAYRADAHKLGFLGNRVVEFVPIKLLRMHEFEEWETRLLEHLKDFTAHDNHEKSVQRLYMEEAYHMPIYGCTFFRCNQKGAHNLPDNVILGVQFEVRLSFHLRSPFFPSLAVLSLSCSPAPLLPIPTPSLFPLIAVQGIKIFDKNRALLASFRIEEVLRWGFKPQAMFYFEVKPSVDMDGTLEFDTKEGKTISDLLTDYALAFIQEKSHEDDRKLGSLPPPPAADAGAGADAREAVRSYTTAPPAAPVSPRAAVLEEVGSEEDDFGKHDDEREDGEEEEEEDIGAEHDAKCEAATRIQALVRGKLLRLEWKREDAAILVQTIYRGHRGRLFVSHMIERMIAEGHFDDDDDDAEGMMMG